MKQTLLLLSAIAVIILLSFTTDKPKKNFFEPLIRLGGFNLIDIKDKSKFMKYAEDETIKKFKLQGLKYATVLGFSQVVAGINYSFFILFRMQDGTSKIYNTVVSNSLKNVLTLSSSDEKQSNSFAFVDNYQTEEMIEFIRQDYIKRKRGDEIIGANCIQLTDGHYYKKGLFVMDVYLTNNRVETVSIYINQWGVKTIQAII